MAKHNLRTNPFRVNPAACLQVANVIRSYRAANPPDNASHVATGANQALTFKVALVAICHDINWDFLQSRLRSLLDSGPHDSLPQRLATVRSPELYSCLADYPKPERISAESRAELLRDVGRTLVTRFGGSAMKIHEASGGNIHGDHGFLAQLDTFLGYKADPLRKKSHVLIQELVRERILRFSDEDQIEPAIDYHIQRLYLRTDRVVCSDPDIEAHLRAYRPRPRPRLVNLLRSEVSEALKLTAFYARLPIPDVNYIEWQVGRSICTRDKPFCIRSKRPIDIAPDVAALFCGACPFVDFCPSRTSDMLRRLKQPNFRTSFY